MATSRKRIVTEIDPSPPGAWFEAEDGFSVNSILENEVQSKRPRLDIEHDQLPESETPLSSPIPDSFNVACPSLPHIFIFQQHLFNSEMYPFRLIPAVHKVNFAFVSVARDWIPN